ncbi:hypothetical protein EMN47_15580 [Prolixibacteraceae bacterium JC049]|nr:hypothetical protein [Prolixibacteraceae bacterium JC049]
MRLLSLLFLLCVMCGHGYSQRLQNNGAYSEAICNASVTLNNAEAIFHNQAGLAQLSKSEILIAYKNRFQLKELAIQSAGITTPIFQGNLFAAFSKTGNSNWNEYVISTGYARSFGKNWQAAFAFYYFTQQLTYEKSNTQLFSYSIGLIYQMNKLKFGFHLFNPTNSNYSVNINQPSHPLQLRIGASYKANSFLSVNIETTYQKNNDTPFNIGIEYYLNKQVTLLGGASTLYAKRSFGIHYQHKKLGGTIAFSSHQHLGFSPTITLKYQFR